MKFAVSARSPPESQGLEASATSDAPEPSAGAAVRTAQDAEQGRLCAGPFTVTAFDGVLGGYSSASVNIDFEPRATGEAETDLLVTLLPLLQGAASLAPLSVHLQVRRCDQMRAALKLLGPDDCTPKIS